jgi:hypothetical protein
MAGSYGMLGLGAPEAMRDKHLADRRSQAMDYARLTPQQQSAFNASNAAQMTGEGMGELLGHGVGMITGSDTRRPEDKLAAVQAQMAQAMRGIDPTDVDAAYPVMIKVLQANGMTPEAMAMAKEYEAIRTQKRTATRLETKDANDARLRQLKLDQFDPRSPLQKNIKELEALMTRADSLPEGPAKTRALELVEVAKNNIAKETKGSVLVEDSGAFLEVINKEDGTLIRRIAKSNDPNKKSDDDPSKPKDKTAAADKSILDMTAAVNDVTSLVRLSQSFHPSYVLGPGMARLAAKIATGAGFNGKVQMINQLFGDNRAGAAWWGAYARLITDIRHAMFGATLTAGETAAFDLIQALIVKSPDDTVNQLKEAATEATTKVESEIAALGDVKNVGTVLPSQLAAVKPKVASMRGSSVSSTYNYTPPAAAAPAAPAAAAPTGIPAGVTVTRTK